MRDYLIVVLSFFVVVILFIILNMILGRELTDEKLNRFVVFLIFIELRVFIRKYNRKNNNE